MVHSKAPPPNLDRSSGDTDLDVDSSVLHIDLNVDTGRDAEVTAVASGESIQGSSLVSIPKTEGMAGTDRNSTSRSPSPEDKSMSEKGETIPQEKPQYKLSTFLPHLNRGQVYLYQ